MTALAHQPALRGRANGGVAARRAVIRWAGRMFRREWRQQILVVTLLTVAVAAAIGSITIVRNTGPGDDAEFGTANTLLNFDASDPQELDAGLAAAQRSFGTIDAIAHRSVAVPGGVETVDFRAQDPDGPYGGVLLALREGSYPKSPTEVAVTDGVAELLQVDIGSSLTLEGQWWTVVGIVENPRKLSEEFALVSPSSALAADRVAVLVDASEEAVDSFFGRGPNAPPAFAGAQRRGNDFSDAPPLVMLSVATVFLLLASLVAAAGFAVVAQRRLRQLGMLAAIGATEKQLRLVLLANGAIVGAIAALVGVTVGLAAWVVFAPTLESAVDHRIDRLSLPWVLIAMAGLVAIVGATAAAWWPGRTVARLPVMLALSVRPPRPRPARRSAILAAALIAVGIACLALSNRDRAPLIVAGIVATILGSLLLGPLAIRIFSGVAGRVPIAPRLALRDLARYQARSGAALAAVTLALGIAATVVVVAAAEETKAAGEPPNLSDRQIRVYTGPAEFAEAPAILTPAQLDGLAARVAQLAGQLDQATVIPLRKVFTPGAPSLVAGDTRVRPTVELARRFDGGAGHYYYTPESQVYVATPAVLRYLGIDPAEVDKDADFLADRRVPTDELLLLIRGPEEKLPVTNVQWIETVERLFGSRDPGDSAAAGTPPTFITVDGLRRRR